MDSGRVPVRRTGSSSSGRAQGWLILSLFAALVALTGGASRYDAIQIVPLRALSALFLIPAFYYLTLESIKGQRALFILFGCYALLVSVQLVPFPPALWQGLPDRSDLAQLDSALGFQDVWRPLTLTPMRSWNVLGSLVVPAAGLLLAVALRGSARVILRVIAGLGVLNAVLGLLQIVTGKSSVFYFYELTNRGSPVGIFANENHAAIFAACSLLVVTSLALRAREVQSASWERLIYPVAFVFILLTALVGASRAGLAATLGAVVISLVMLFLSPRTSRGHSVNDPVRRWLDKHSGLVVVVPVVAITLTAATFMLLDRTPAFQDLLSRDSLADLRWSLWPVIAAMIATHWALGTGFGSFEQVYNIYEPSELLMPQYVNQAHNDWAQFVIEGGIPGVLILIALFVWMARAIVKIAAKNSARVNALFWVSIFAIVGVASLVDYPLRTPIFQLVAIWLLVALSRDMRDRHGREVNAANRVP